MKVGVLKALHQDLAKRNRVALLQDLHKVSLSNHDLSLFEAQERSLLSQSIQSYGLLWSQPISRWCPLPHEIQAMNLLVGFFINSLCQQGETKLIAEFLNVVKSTSAEQSQAM